MTTPVTFAFPDNLVQVPAHIHLYRDDEHEKNAVMGQTRSKQFKVGVSPLVSGMRGNDYPYTFEVQDDPQDGTTVRVTVRDSTNEVVVIPEDGQTQRTTNGTLTFSSNATVEIGGYFAFDVKVPE